MTRYLVLEVLDEVHDLADLLEDMRQFHDGLATLRVASAYALDVKIPARPLAVAWFKDNEPRDPRQVYIEEAR